MNQGSTVFAQFMSLIPRRQFNNCVARYNGNYRVRNLSCYDQFLVMCMAQYANKNSLRDIEASLTAISHKLYMSGISYAVPRNTLAKANELRDWRIYRDFGQILIERVRPLYADDPSFRLDLDNAVYAFDSSTISLCLKLCPWARFRKTKAGVKMHTLLDLRGNIPAFVYLTDASVHDVRMLDELCIEMGAIYVMDKGYVDFFRLYNRIHNGAFFVTRAKDNVQYEVVKSNPVDKNAGVIADEIIKLTTYKSAKSYPEELRMVTYEDFATGNVYRFLTNHLGYEALTIAELYRERWNVELFFKWIKQHLHIKSFYGTSENAVYTQIWIAVCSFLLIALAKKKWNLDQSLYTISQTIGFMLFEKIPVNQLFIKSKKSCPADDYPNLFSFSES